MTTEQIKEAIAKAIYCHKGHLPAPWDCAGDGWDAQWSLMREEAESQAAAVMALVGPKKLVWSGSESDCYMQATTTTGMYCVGVFGAGWYAEFEPHNAPKPYSIGWHYDSALSAQAAAQAHAGAAHWANTALVDMIGGK